ncbi:DUF1801 domain-containing protein [Aquimarina aggregata]|uniref:DUF1801 domain-containing protein n=1 Tax=Aquimarina aggregata TaxID=1642818 RepID=UPI0024904202|nr:DUF1801 domain-containing protein [Aquimarina aggregata]
MREIHPDFLNHLKYKDQDLIDLYTGLRNLILDIYPDSYELLYHTHALTSVYSVSEKMGDSFCMIPIYTNHLNLGFNKGTLLKDPKKILQGTGKFIRHIPIVNTNDYRNDKVQTLINSAIELAIGDASTLTQNGGITISKIK